MSFAPGLMLGAGWTPQRLSPFAWWYAHASLVTLDGSGVSEWRDRSGNGRHLQQASSSNDPEWEASGGWSAIRSSVAFGAAPWLDGAHSSLLTAFDGEDAPFSVLCTLQLASTATDQVVLAWDNDASSSAKSVVRTENTGSGKLRYYREDDGAASANQTGAVDLGTGHKRIGVIFTGTAVSLYVDATLDVNAGACNVGSCDFNRLRVGTGPVVDALNGRMAELVLLDRAISGAEWAQYLAYSQQEWN